jgi:hypothetical protein
MSETYSQQPTCRLEQTPPGVTLAEQSAEKGFGNSIRNRSSWLDLSPDFVLPNDATLGETLIKIGGEDLKTDFRRAMFKLAEKADCMWTGQSMDHAVDSLVDHTFAGIPLRGLIGHTVNMIREPPFQVFEQSKFEEFSKDPETAMLVRLVTGETGYVQSWQSLCHKTHCPDSRFRPGQQVKFDKDGNSCHLAPNESKDTCLPFFVIPDDCTGCSKPFDEPDKVFVDIYTKGARQCHATEEGVMFPCTSLRAHSESAAPTGSQDVAEGSAMTGGIQGWIDRAGIEVTEDITYESEEEPEGLKIEK